MMSYHRAYSTMAFVRAGDSPHLRWRFCLLACPWLPCPLLRTALAYKAGTRRSSVCSWPFLACSPRQTAPRAERIEASGPQRPVESGKKCITASAESAGREGRSLALRCPLRASVLSPAAHRRWALSKLCNGQPFPYTQTPQLSKKYANKRGES